MIRQAHEFDVVVVGAGPAGIGIGCVLKGLGLQNFVVFDKHEVGASFQRWPREMRLITPSFPSNAYGFPDLNAITADTSPGYTLETEHPTGRQYARYLHRVVKEFNVPVQTGVNVTEIRSTTDGFEITTQAGTRTAKYVIWAAGEFQYPKVDPFPGAEYCQHTATVPSWRDVAGDEFLIIGGYESGIDAATALCRLGKTVTVLDRRSISSSVTSDPSVALSPFTQARLRQADRTGRLSVLENFKVMQVEREGEEFLVIGRQRQKKQTVLRTKTPPLLATGFDGSLSLVESHFARDEAGVLQLSPDDESTITPGLFLCGPMVRHGAIIMCFIYKYRQRFAVVANAIGQRMGLDLSPLEVYRKKQMFLDDLSCCLDECAC